MFRPTRPVLVVAVLAAFAPSGRAQFCAGLVADDPSPHPYLATATGGLLYTVGAVPQGHGIARLDGALWTPLPGAFNASVRALADTPMGLVAGGSFNKVDDVLAFGVARRVGNAWVPLGVGIGGGAVPEVRALLAHGGFVYVGGSFETAGGLASANIAGSDGGQWFSIGGANGAVESLESHLGRLVAAGAFTSIGGQSIAHVAAWNGTAWAALGSPLPPVTDLASGGGQLYAAAGGDVYTLVGNAWVPSSDPIEIDARRIAALGDTLLVQGPLTTPCDALGVWPCIARALRHGGVWQTLLQDADHPHLPSLSVAGLDGAFWDTGGSKGLVEYSARPKPHIAVDGAGAWHADNAFTILGDCFDPALPATVQLGDAPPLPAVVVSPTELHVTVPALWLEGGGGALVATVEQGGATGSTPGAFLVWPYLRTHATNIWTCTASWIVDTPPGTGKAWAFVAAAPSPIPLTLPGIAGAWQLDAATTSYVAWGNLMPFFAEVVIALPVGSIPVGLTVPAQALVYEEATSIGPLLSFTQWAPIFF